MIAIEDERHAKDQIMRFLSEEGYPRYAKLLSFFDVNRTSDPNTVAYVENDRARIVINKNLYLEQISVIIRHELLHRWLRHNYRLEQHVGKDKWDKRTELQHKLGNIAADYEISNRGYTEEDKKRVRTLMVGDRVLRGLVTEDDHPEWVNMSVEEMYDELTKMVEKDKNAFERYLDELKKSGLLDDMDDNTPGTGSGDNGESDGMSDSKESTSEKGNRSHGSAITDIEDIARALKVKKELSQSNGKQDQADQHNDNIDDLIDLADDLLKKLENNPDMSDKDKDNLKKQLVDKVTKSSEEGEEKSDTEPTYNDTDESIDDKLRKLAKDIEKQVKEDEIKLSNPDLNRSQIDDEIKIRVENISDLFKDAAALKDAISETNDRQYRDNLAKRDKQRKKERNNERHFHSTTYNKQLFLSNLDKLIQSQLKRDRESTYKIPSRKKVFGSRTIYSGTRWQEKRIKPRVVVYYDRSGSWQVPWKTKAGDDAISMLNDRYVKRGLIDLEIRYFADTVSDNANNVGYGNRATQEILDDVVKQKATNVILLTDDNINIPKYYTHPITVPGGVFYIFVESESPAIVNAMRGKQMTKVYFISNESEV